MTMSNKETDIMELKMEIAYLKDHNEEMLAALTKYRNEIRYMHGILRSIIGSIKQVAGEYNDRVTKVKELDEFLKTMGGLGGDPYENDETKPRPATRPKTKLKDWQKKAAQAAIGIN